MVRGIGSFGRVAPLAAPESGSEGQASPGSGFKGKQHVGADERIDSNSSIVELNKRVGTAGIGVGGQDPGDSATAGAGDAGLGTAGAAGVGRPEGKSGSDAERAGGGPTSAGSAPASSVSTSTSS